MNHHPVAVNSFIQNQPRIKTGNKQNQEAQRQQQELAAQLREAREEAAEKLRNQAKEALLQEYYDLLYDLDGNRSYNESVPDRNQRLYIQERAGFGIKVQTREPIGGPPDPLRPWANLADTRPWIKLDTDYCQAFSVGEVKAMLDALRQYRATTPKEEWMPIVTYPVATEKVEEAEEAEEVQETTSTADLPDSK
jgi:hypothetical protein